MVMLMWDADYLLLGSFFFLFLSFFPPIIHKFSLYIFPKTEMKKSEGGKYKSITFFLPIRNESSNITKKLDEIISSKYPDELKTILVIDSCSIDNSVIIAKDYLEKNSAGIPWKVESITPPGKSYAVNLALDTFETEILLMMDSDSLISKNSFERISSCFDDDSIGAVCGKSGSGSTDGGSTYRQNFNNIRLKESSIDSTPIFEGSICAFRKEAIGSDRINPEINADDTQLSIISRKNGFRSIMDHNIEFLDKSEKPTRSRLVRRSQGLFRALASNSEMTFGKGVYSWFFSNALFFYLVMPWLFIISIISLILYLTFTTPQLSNYSFVQFPYLLLILVIISRYLRFIFEYLVGVSILLESQIRLLLGQKLHVWDPAEKSG